MADPIVIQPGTSTTVAIPVELTADGASVASISVTRTVTAAPSPVTPWVVPTDDPNAVSDVKEIQTNVGVTSDGKLGRVTLDAIKAAVKPAVVTPPQPVIWQGFGTNQKGWQANGFGTLDAFEKAVGRPFDWIRQFHQSDDVAASDEEKFVAARGGNICSSWKLTSTNYAGFLAATDTSTVVKQVNTYLDFTLGLPGVNRVDVCFNHEHNNPNVAMKDGTNQQFADSLKKFAKICRAHPKWNPAKHRIITIWVPSTFKAAEWPLDPASFDAVGGDPYRWADASATNWEQLAGRMAGVTAYAKSLGKPVVVPEFGVAHIDGHGAERAKTITDFMDWSRANADYACYFSSGNPNDVMPLKRDPEAWSAYVAKGNTYLTGA